MELTHNLEREKNTRTQKFRFIILVNSHPKMFKGTKIGNFLFKTDGQVKAL